MPQRSSINHRILGETIVAVHLLSEQRRAKLSTPEAELLRCAWIHINTTTESLSKGIKQRFAAVQKSVTLL